MVETLRLQMSRINIAFGSACGLPSPASGKPLKEREE
jgi:hypothetical protein